MSPFRSIPAPIIVLVCGLISGCSAEHGVYEEFRNYRIAVSSDPGSAAGYFSHDYLSDSLGGLLEVEFPENLAHMDDIRYIFLYVSKIKAVHYYSVQRTKPARYELVLHYSNDDGDLLQKFGLRYVQSHGRYLIEGFDFYLEPIGEIPAVIVDDFSDIAELGAETAAHDAA